MWLLVVSGQAQKSIERIGEQPEARILDALELLRYEPFAGKKLGGHPARYSLRVWPFRIIYEIDKRRKIIAVIRSGHRQGVYR